MKGYPLRIEVLRRNFNRASLSIFEKVNAIVEPQPSHLLSSDASSEVSDSNNRSRIHPPPGLDIQLKNNANYSNQVTLLGVFDDSGIFVDL